MVQLLGYARVELEPGASADVTLDVPTHRLALSDRRMVRVVEPGRIDLFVGPDCEHPELTGAVAGQRLSEQGIRRRIGDRRHSQSRYTS